MAERLVREHGIPALDLDTVAWERGQIAVARDWQAARADVRRFCGRSGGWVVEGCYAGLIEATLSFRPELLFLDPGLEACLAHCRERPWEPHKYPSKSEQDARLPFLLEWVADYYRREGDLSWRRHCELFEAYTGPKRWLRE